MRELDSLDSLNIPEDYKEYLGMYLENISDVPYIRVVYLFGSCASGTVNKYSDIDLFITTDREISDEEEAELTLRKRPPYTIDSIPMDIIVQTEDKFNRLTDNTRMVQNQVIRKGINVNGLLSKRG